MKSLRKIIEDGVHYFTRRGFGSKKWKKHFAYYGDGATIAYPANILGSESIEIGDGTVILDHSRIANFELTESNRRFESGRTAIYAIILRY